MNRNTIYGWTQYHLKTSWKSFTKNEFNIIGVVTFENEFDVDTYENQKLLKYIKKLNLIRSNVFNLKNMIYFYSLIVMSSLVSTVTNDKSSYQTILNAIEQVMKVFSHIEQTKIPYIYLKFGEEWNKLKLTILLPSTELTKNEYNQEYYYAESLLALKEYLKTWLLGKIIFN